MHQVNSIDNHFSVKTLRFFMRLVGMWPVETFREQLISDALLSYVIGTLFGALIIQTADLFYSRNDLHALSYNAPTTITVIIEVFKLAMFVANRSELMSFNAYTEKIFWKPSHNEAEWRIVNECNRRIIRIVGIHIFIVQCVAWLYFSIPIVESSGQNVSERSLPFKLHFNIPYTRTPYYEICFIVESACALTVGFSTTGFGGFLCTTNLYAAGQFKILQRKLELTCYNNGTNFSHFQSKTECQSHLHNWLPLNLSSSANLKHHTDLTKDNNEQRKSNSSQFTIPDIKSMRTDDLTIADDAPYALLKDCIKQHQLLIQYMGRVENLFSAIMLAQTLGSILELCFAGFQILLGVGTSVLRTALSIQFLTGSMVLLLFFSWSSHEIIIESQEVAEAAYRASWYGLGYSNEEKAFRQALLIIIARARKPCILTVGKFVPMSLDTFTSVFNTSISYFTILRQVNEEKE